MRSRIVGLLVMAVALGCQSGGTTTAPPRGGLEEEPRMTEPGLGEGSGLTRSTAPGMPDFRVIYFDFDDSTLRSDAQEGLRANAQIMRDNPDLRIQIQGHCDERGTDEYNLALGQRRAESAKRYLVDLGIRPARIDTKTYGEARPAVVGHNESAWAKNRRDEFAALR